MIKRILEDKIKKALRPGFVVGLFGARRTGKTVLMEAIIKEINDKKSLLYLIGENLDTTEILASKKLSRINQMLSGKKYLFIDEAQKVPDIGEILKLIVDTNKQIKVMITGSSALELKSRIGEPLTGRSKFFYLYPFSQLELNEDWLTYKNKIEEKLIYGMYPQVIIASDNNEKKDVLESIKNGYLLKDILELDRIKDSIFILNLLRLLAFQIGKDISYNELARALGANVKTIQRYLELLEKTYIIFSLHGFSKNLRKEYIKSPRYYFWDNGIRNALIANFNSLHLRDDVGILWENFCIAERMKFNHYTNRKCNTFFWRTYDMQEIDYLEECEGKLFAFEFKWQEKKIKIPPAFKNSYSNFVYYQIHQDNFFDLLSDKTC